MSRAGSGKESRNGKTRELSESLMVAEGWRGQERVNRCIGNGRHCGLMKRPCACACACACRWRPVGIVWVPSSIQTALVVAGQAVCILGMVRNAAALSVGAG